MATTTSRPSNNTKNIPQSKKLLPIWLMGSVLLIVLASLILGASWITLPAATTALPAPSVPLAYDATGTMLNSIVYPTYPDQRIQSPLAQYDASGAMLDAVVFSHQVRPAFQGLAYDATGAMLGAVVFPTYSDQQVSIPISQGLAYDATGAMLDAVVLSHQLRPAFQGLGYDATGAMRDVVVFPTYSDQRVSIPTSPGLAYDATAAMLYAIVFPPYFDQRVNIPTSQRPAYDATGAMLEAVVFPNFPE